MRPDWVIIMKVEPKSKTDATDLVTALAQMVLEDPTLGYFFDRESGELIIAGLDELHLDSAVDDIQKRFRVEVVVGPPQVAYRETLAQSVEVDCTHKKQTGRTGEFARVKLRLEPNGSGGGNVFASAIVGGAVPQKFITAVEKGVRSVWNAGVLIGFPMVHMKVTLYDGGFHEVDSSAIAFEIASRNAMTEGCAKAGVNLLEPIMDLEVVTPEDFVGSVIGDINSRRGFIRAQEVRGNATVIRAHMPIATLFGYKYALLAISNGRASHTLRFSHYAEVPPNISTDDPNNFPPAVGMRQA
jgi:elongation factor G